MLSAVMGVALVGCSGGDSGTTKTEAGGDKGTATTEFKVGLVTPGPVSDSGWNALAFDGLKAIETDLSAQVVNQEATGTKARDAMRTYAQQGYNLVFGHGFEYNSIAMEIAPDFPDTVFVTSSGGGSAKNVGAFRFNLEQGCYVAGFMAAKMSKTGTIAAVAIPDIPSIDSTLKAYEAGAKAANPNIKVITVRFASDGDVAGAKRATESAIDQGADFVIHQANAAAQGVFDACKERKVNAIGTNANQNDNASGVVVASAIIVAKPAFLALAKEVKDKTYVGSIRLVGMQEDAIDFVVKDGFTVPEALKAEIEQLKADIKSGKVVVPKDEF